MALPSIFNNNKSSLSKRATISSKPTVELPSNDNTMSKVKRFGSLLIRNKKSSVNRQRVDTVFPNPIDTSLASSYSLSTASTNTHSSDEDDLITPTTPVRSPIEMTFEKEDSIVLSVVTPTVSDDVETMSVTPQVQTNQVQEDNIIYIKEEESIAIHQQEMVTSILDASEMTKSSHVVVNELDPSLLSGVSLVRYHLNMALEEADEEIEQELDSCRLQMLQSLYTVPTFAF